MRRNEAVPFQGKQSEKEIQRIISSGVHFSGKRPAAKGVWIPKRQMKMPDGVYKEVKPRIGLIDAFGTIDDGELIG